MLGDSRGIFFTAESALSAIRFRVALSVLGSCLVENCFEENSHFGWREVGRMECVRQDEVGGGKKAIRGVLQAPLKERLKRKRLCAIEINETAGCHKRHAPRCARGEAALSPYSIS